MILIKQCKDWKILKMGNTYQVIEPNGTTLDFKFLANAELCLNLNTQEPKNSNGFEDHHFWS